jgi:ligand-binding SRPBCC domain-containing protein
VTIHTIQRRQKVHWPIEQVFGFFADAGNLDRLTPPWLNFQVRTPQPVTMQAGARIEYTIRWRGLPIRWLTEIEEWTPEKRFVDVQVRGPYRLWHHTHCFEAVGDETVMEDEVRYALPLGPIGVCAHSLLVKRDVESIFDYRARRIADLLRT